LARAGSSGFGSLFLRCGSWLRDTRHYVVLILLDFVFYSGWSALSGIPPAGDIRAHIFRTLEFVPGLFGGDYTSIQYHGYAFLAGYGIGFYTITWSMYSFLSIFFAGFQAATIACNVMWVLTPLILSFSAVALADALGIGRSSHRKRMQVALGATVLLFPGVVGTSLAGSDPYMLSFAFSLLALAYGLRSDHGGRGLLGLLAFSALSIYVEGFGYFFIGAVFIGLLATRRSVLKVLPFLAAITAFSWVQLLEVSRYMAPYIEEVPAPVVGFLPVFAAMVLIVCAYSCVFFLFRHKLDERQRVILIVVEITVLATAAAVARGSFGLDFGPLNALIVNILPWRLLFVNIPVLLIVSIYSWNGAQIGLPGLRKTMVVVSVLLISAPILLGTYPIAFGPMPSQGEYVALSGNRLLVAGPALLATASPIAYSPAFGYSTVSGAFSQGDPSFFALTAYYEWSDNLVNNALVAENLMHLTGANELITSPSNSQALTNSSVSSAAQGYSQAEAVTPILLEAPNSTEALEFALFVNLLGKNGFTLDFVTSPIAGEIFGAVVLPGYQGATPGGLPEYRVQNSSFEPSSLGLPLVKPFVTLPLEPFGPASNASLEAASSMAASLITFFHPTYDPVTLTAGQNYYSVSSNSSLPIQIAVSYYPYFAPANYAQNVYHFILLPGPERISWHLPYYEVAAAVSLVASLACALLGRRLLPKSRSAGPSAVEA